MYYCVSYQFQYFIFLNSKFMLMVNGEIGYVDGYGGKGLFFYKNFYGGGVSLVWGYKVLLFGFIIDDNGNEYCIGGNCWVVGNVELLWSLLGMEKSFCMGWFFDVGQVYGKGENFVFGDLCYLMGILVVWILLIGLLKFSFGLLFNKKEMD